MEKQKLGLKVIQNHNSVWNISDGVARLWRNHLTGHWRSSAHLCSSHGGRKYLYAISGSKDACTSSISESPGTDRVVCYESCFFSEMINLFSENKTNPDTTIVAFSSLNCYGFNWDFGGLVQLIFQRISKEEDEEETGTAKQLLTTTHPCFDALGTWDSYVD